MEMLYKDIDKAEMPPGSGTMDNPFYWFTSVVPEEEDCAEDGCSSIAHMGLVMMREDDKERWGEKQDTDELMDVDVVFYCVMHYVPAIERVNSEPS